MLGFIITILFLVMAIHIARVVVQESAIYSEFGQSRGLAGAVALFPLGPVALMALTFRLGQLPAAIVALACYLPAMVISRRQFRVFDQSGTDRTKQSQHAVSRAFAASIVGILYVAINLVVGMISDNIGVSG